MVEPNYIPPINRGNPANRPRFRIGRILFPLIFAIIVLVALSERIPVIQDAKDKLLNPAEYQARQACHATALAAAEQPAYARIVDRGDAHPTQGAVLVEGVTVGEMGKSGAETTFRFSCYVDPDGKVVKTSRQ